MNSSMDSSVGVESSVMFEPTSTFEAPSTSQLTALRRWPAIEMLTLAVRPTPTSSGSELLTPGTSVASCTKLRLLSGSSWTCVEPISVCTAGIGWIIWAAASTFTVSVTPPSFIAMSSRTRSATWSSMPRAVAVWKPESANTTS